MASDTATPPTSQTNPVAAAGAPQAPPSASASASASATPEATPAGPTATSNTTTTATGNSSSSTKALGKDKEKEKDRDTKSQGLTATVVQATKKYIPGLGAQPDKPGATAPSGGGASKRSKGSRKAKIANANDPALQTALTAEAPEKNELPKELIDDKAPTGTGANAGAATKTHPTLSSTNGNAAGDVQMTSEELEVLQQKRFSPVLIIQKRLRAHNKKLQRIAAYENETNLNADQRKALATKPALELVQKELSDIIKVFEAEEAEDEKHTARKKQYEEKQTQIRIHQALNQSKVSSQTDLTLLLQFLHLYSLFNPAQSFAPPTNLPAVVANATGQQSAAVHTLFDKLANGPLFGAAATTSTTAGSASDDAVSHIKALQEGASSDIVEGVTFADVKQMIIDLTAPPAEIGHEIPESSTNAVAGTETGLHPSVDESAQQNATSTDDTAGATAAGAAPGFNFMQASELEQPAHHGGEAGAVSAHERALESVSAAATPGFGSGTPILEKSVEQATPVGWESASPAEGGAQAATASWVEDTSASAPIKNWADDVDESGLSNPYTSTPDVPSELAATNGVPVINSDARTSRGRGRGGPRGGRGEPRRGRGGNAEGGRQMHWRRTDPVNESAANAAIAAGEGNDGFIEAGADRRGSGHRGSAGRGRGEYRGGRPRGAGGERGPYRGSGEHRGRGRGGPRGPSNAAAASAPATNAAPVGEA